MLFSSPTFIAFFLVYFLAHLATAPPYRIFLIIGGSTFFYAWWKIEYVWLPYLLMAISYFGVLWLEATEDKIARRRRLIVIIVLLFTPLVFFKYTDFFYGDVIGPIVGWRGKILSLPLPLGISFVTFTLTAYVVDVYTGRFKANTAPATVLGHVLFFPHLIAGPILRPSELIPQLEKPRPALPVHFTFGVGIFTLGLVKKLVFADHIAIAVNQAYAQTAPLSATDCILAIYGFSMQIYCDFSGYTDMAIGAAALLGVRLPTNFKQPYCAASLVDFWRRWHITLSFWLRDYLYIPLGGNRQGTGRTYRNIIFTMALGGLWHGASWNFIVWGLLHGLGVSAVHCWKTLLGHRINLPRWMTVFITFNFVTVAWVFFRASDIRHARAMLKAPFIVDWHSILDTAPVHSGIILLALFFLLHPFDDYRRIVLATRRLPPQIVWPTITLLWCLSFYMARGASAPFIYFEF